MRKKQNYINVSFKHLQCGPLQMVGSLGDEGLYSVGEKGDEAAILVVVAYVLLLLPYLL